MQRLHHIHQGNAAADDQHDDYPRTKFFGNEILHLRDRERHYRVSSHRLVLYATFYIHTHANLCQLLGIVLLGKVDKQGYALLNLDKVARRVVLG